MKKLLITALLPVTYVLAQPANGTAPKQVPQTKPMPAPKADCTKLTAQEQDFANQLNPMNKALFCTRFTADMRKSAMEKAGEMGMDGTLVTNDQATEQVAKDYNLTVPSMPGTRPSGSCPAK